MALRRTLLLLGTALLGAASPPQGDRYVNDRFGFSCRIPAGFVMDRPPDDDDGRTFHSQDGTAELLVYAGYNAAEHTLRQEIGLHGAGCLRQPPEYLALRPRWAVLSCQTKDGFVYVRKEVRGRGIDAVFTTVRMLYPAAERSRWDPVAAWVAASLQAAVP